MKILGTFLILGSILSSAASSGFADAASEEASSKPSLNVVQSGDKLAIDVYRERDLSGVFIVNGDGNIDYPLLGEIHADGLTLEEMEGYLTQALGADYLIEPKVRVEYEESFNKSIFVLGQVARPGNYTLPSNNLTLLRMVFHAGGFTADAATGGVEIARVGPDGKRLVINVDVSAILKGKAEDVKLEQGDIIMIPREERKPESSVPSSSVAILGQVARAGNYNYTTGMTLVKLISQAGGFTGVASPGQVRIVRFSADRKSKAIYVNAGRIFDGKAPDVPLEVGDVVIVPESFF